VISRKELARELRRQAYRKAKQARAADPRQLAMKEVAKQRRRELYQQVKERRKERDTALKTELKAKEKAAQAASRAEGKRQLAERVKGAIGRGSEPGRALARDIERALQCADVRDLMERLRGESAALAAQHRDDGPVS
jgi:hypothetical protein